MIATRQQPQALCCLVDQLGLRQDAAADRHHGIGGQDESAIDVVIDADPGKRGRGLSISQPVGADARQLAVERCLVDLGRTQRVRLDAGLVDQAEATRRTGSEDEFGPADHEGKLCLRPPPRADGPCPSLENDKRVSAAQWPRKLAEMSEILNRDETWVACPYSLPAGTLAKRSLMRRRSWSRTAR